MWRGVVVAALWWVAAAGPGPPGATQPSPATAPPAPVLLQVPELAAPGTPALPPPGSLPVWRPRPADTTVQFRLRHGDRTFRADTRCLGDRCFLTLRVRAAHDLNRERKDQYRVTVRATTADPTGAVLGEEDIPVRIEVTDVNDLSPLFYPTEYVAELREDAQLHATVAVVTAEDADLGLGGEIYYSLERDDDQFAVHPTSGAVTLTRPLSHTAGSTHRLHVLARDRAALLDRGDRAPAARANVTLHVLPANLHAPTLRVSTASTVQSPTAGTVVAVLDVSDGDESVHGTISSVEIVDGDPDGHFRIRTVEPTRVEVVVHELARGPAVYNLTVRAVDGGSPPRDSYAVVAVTLGGAADAGPVFARELYEARVAETAPPGTPLVRLKVAAPLPGVYLEIVGGNEGGEFRVEPEGGVLYTAVWLDAETKSQYTLTVSAVDHADLGPRRQSSAKVVVTVLDANDNDPVFEQTDLEVTVKENGPPGEVVARVTARDADSGENAYISYSIVNLQPVPFEIEHFSGVIRTTHQLDFETMRREYSIYVRAGDWGVPYRRQAETAVRVRVLDINDNRPQFERVDCVGYLANKIAIGTEVFTFSAIDFDSGDVVSYRIVSGNEDNCFSLDSSTGVLSAVCDLSDERTDTRVLNVTATDGTHFADSTSITLHLSASRGGAPDRGAGGAELECRETGAARTLTELMSAADRSNAPLDPTDEFPLAPSRYGENLHTPELIDFPVEIKVNESVKLGTTLVKLKAHDRDLGFNGLLTFVISNGDEDSAFRVDPETGELQVIGHLDREREAEYYLNVTAVDQGRPRRAVSRLLPVTVLDVNDNAPSFQKSLASYRVTENAINGTVIFRANATDPDSGEFGRVTYSVIGTELGEFCIDRFSGTLAVCAPLDRERRSLYELTVRATDGGGLSAVAAVRVSIDDVNDNAPRFSQHSYSVRVPEDYPRGALVAVLEARDPDLGRGGAVTYSLADPADEHVFSVDAVSGAVRLRQTLDYESRRSYVVTVRATDGGAPALSTDVAVSVEVQDVDENRHTPEFPGAPAATVRVSEGLRAGAVVGEVRARDGDGPGRDGRVSYSLVGGSGLAHFSVDDSATLRTLSPLDAETTQHYWLTLCAQDHGLISRYSCIQVYVEVTDVNDMYPWPVQAAYQAEVPENCGAGLVVGTVTAPDPDVRPAAVTYRLVAGNPDGLFTVDAHTGVVRTTGRVVDREAAGRHALEVAASDGGLVSTVRLQVTVTDQNDHTPTFTRAHYRLHPPTAVEEPPLEEDAEETDESDELEPNAVDHSDTGLYLLTVVALDADAGENGTVRYTARGGRGRVSVHPSTGRLYLAPSAPADRHYRLSVRACDGGQPPRCGWTRVWVSPRSHLHQSDSPAPVLSAPPALQVAELDPPGFLVALLQAYHPNNDTLFYDIVGGDTRQEFYIGHDDGSLIVAKRLLWERQREYTLNVSVSDGRHTVYTPVNITVVNDLNEQGVKFTQQIYEFEVAEDIAIGEIFGKIVAIGGPGARILYGIHGVKDNVTAGTFRVDELSGEVSAARALDAETSTRHWLTVWARDSAPRASRAFSRVSVFVQDRDDHPPVWGRRLAEVRLPRDLPVGGHAATLFAADPDTDAPAVRYSLDDSEYASYFSIEPALGSLTLTRSLPPVAELALQVRAATGERWSSLAVRVVVVEPERLPPSFSSGLMEVHVSEAADPGTVVVAVEAVAATTVWYTLDGGDGLFAVNPLLGTVTVRARLDYETGPLHELRVTATGPIGAAATAVVRVHVQDANEYPPVLTRAWYRGRVSESSPAGALVWEGTGFRPLVFDTTDGDSPEHRLREYHILEPAADAVFAVNWITGALSIKRPLDFELQPVYNFTVKVVDGGSPAVWARSEARVSVAVLDEDDEPPALLEPEIRARLSVPTAAGVAVCAVRAADPDTPAARLRYRLLSGADAYALDAVTGALTVLRPELVADGPVAVAVRDGGGREARGRVLVETRVVTPAGLTFPREAVAVSALEHAPRPATLAHLHVLGAALHDTITYHILNPTPEFTIGVTSGVVRTTAVPLDREVRDAYSLLVEARSTGPGEERVCRTVVEVAVTDVNDHCPQWTHRPYSGAVSAGDPPDTLVTVVSATDRDAGDNGDVRYELVRGHGELFRLDRRSGRLTLKRAPDAGHDTYLLTVAAYDGGAPPCGVEAPVTVRVYGGGAAPSWPRALYDLRVPYDLPLLAALSPPLVANSPLQRQLIYSLVDPENHPDLDIHFDTAAYRRGSSPCAVVAVSRGGAAAGERTEEVGVVALDGVGGAVAETRVRVHWEGPPPRPVWPRDPRLYTASVSETAPYGTVVLTLPLALNSTEVVYSVVELRGVEVMEGAECEWTVTAGPDGVEVALRGALDAELRTQVRLMVTAALPGAPPAHKHLHITVENVNDCAPVLVGGPVAGTVSAEADPGTVAAAVRAWDPDGDVLRYRAVGHWPDRYRVDVGTGAVYVTGRGAGAARLTVAVEDGAHVLLVPVEISAAPSNLHAPHFPHLLYEVRVPYNATPPIYLTTVKAEDPDLGDYGTVRYSIEPSDLFSVDEVTGAIRAVGQLAGRGEWEVGVWARDGGGRAGRGAVRVRLEGTPPDTRPRLTRLRGCAPPGGRVAVVARPGAGPYRLRGAARDTDQLHLDPATGELSFKNNTTLRAGACVSVWVEGGLQTAVSACVGVPPATTAPPPAVFLPETAAPGTLLASLAPPRPPPRPVRYSLLTSPRSDTFSVDSEGLVYLAAPLDRETYATHAIGIVAEWADGAEGGCARQEETVLHVLDANDNPPEFTARTYHLTLAENTPPHSTVFTVRAVDRDAGSNGEVRYSLEEEPGSEGTFAVDAETGALRTERPLDREARAQYALGLVARDAGGLRGRARLQVSLQDYPDTAPVPVPPPPVSLAEDVPVGTVVCALRLEDVDEAPPPRRYLLLAGDPAGKFAVRDDGTVVLVRPLDRELAALYRLSLVVTDGRFSANTTLHVTVTDVNDNPPYCVNDEYEIEVSEDVAVGTSLLTLETSDADQPQNAVLQYSVSGAGADLVRVGATGDVVVAAPLDRERGAQHRLLLTAQDPDRPAWTCSSRLTLTLLDVNDNTPAFTADLYRATLAEDAEPGTPVIKVTATDPDSGRNRVVRYRLLDGDDAAQFALDTTNGVVTLRLPLDRETRAELRALVEARDLGDPARSATATLLLSVADVNDNPPEFTYRQYAAAVPELDAPGSQVLRVEAVSRDSGPNARVHYDLLDGDGREDFAVDRLSGVVSVARPLDYERRQSYLLTVRAEDEGEPPLSDVAVLNITVTDVNDNEPRFERTSYGARVREDAPPGTEVAVVRAHDPDSGAYGAVRYALGGGGGGPFAVDAVSGVVSVAGSLDRESTPAHVVEVVAADGGAPPLRATVTLSVEVADVNDCAPRFASHNHSAVLREDRPLDHPLLRLDVSDQDAPPNGAPFTFDFRSGNEMGAFRLDQDGYLRTATRFNHRIKDHYLLQVRVFDNGTPPLFADTWVRVEVVEQSRFPPVLSPLHATLVWRGTWPGGDLATLAATDRDQDDQLTYSAAGDPALTVHPTAGTVLLAPGAPPGQYLLNVTVSDGRYATSAPVRVTYVHVTDALLDAALVVRFRAVSPSSFVERHRRGFLRAVAEAVGAPLEDVVLLAVQTSDGTGPRRRRDVPRDLDVLFAVRGVSPAEVRRQLHAHLAPLEERTRLVVEELVRAACLAGCVRGACRERVRLSGAVRPVGGDVAVLAAPEFAVEARCECEAGWAGARCEQAECTRCGAAVHLHGRGAVAARVEGAGAVAGARPLLDELVVSVRVRTWRGSGTVVWAGGPVDEVALQLVDGAAVARLELGAGEVAVRAGHVADGAWHDLVLERRGASLRLSVDRHSAHAVAPPSALVLDTYNPVVYFGAVVSDTEPKISHGFVGCLSDVTLGGRPVEVTSAINGSAAGEERRRGGAVETRLVGGGAEAGCVLGSADECAGVDCGPGLCAARAGAALCDCPARWAGAHCHVPVDPCGERPCLHGGLCRPGPTPPGYTCECPAGLSGARCHLGRYCAVDSACLHGGGCEEGVGGATCSCRGYYGPRCELDVDECAGEPCLNGATCVNEPGSFRCVCPPDRTGAHCGNPLHSNAVTAGADSTLREVWARLSGLDWRWAAAVAAVLLLAVALCLVSVAVCRRRPRPAPALRQNNVPAPPPKLSNLEASLRPRSCAPDAAPSPPPLNNMDTLRSYGSAGDELEALPQHYIRNLNLDSHIVKPWSEQMHLHTFTDNKIHNDLKASMEQPAARVRERGGALVGGYHWDVSDWAGPGGDWADSTGEWGSGLDSSSCRGPDSEPEEADPLLEVLPPAGTRHSGAPDTASLITMMEVGAAPDHTVCDIDDDSDADGHTAV